MPEHTLSLRDALVMHKQASVEKSVRAVLLKAAANYVIALNTPDVKFRKAASADLAAAVVRHTMVKGGAYAGRRGGSSKEEKKAGLSTYLFPQYAKARAMQRASGAGKNGILDTIGTFLRPDISQAKSQERLAGTRAGTDIRGNKNIDTPSMMRLMPRGGLAQAGAPA